MSAHAENGPLIIFDFFGVVCTEIAPFWLERYFTPEQVARVKAELVAPADRGEVTEEEMFRNLARAAGVDARQALDDWLALARLDTETLSYVRELRARYPVALLSNAPAAFLHRLLRRDGLYDAFDRLMISSEERIAKPDARIYRRLLQAMDARPERAVMIDDNPSNLAGAAEAGIAGVLFESAAQLRRALPAALARLG